MTVKFADGEALRMLEKSSLLGAMDPMEVDSDENRPAAAAGLPLFLTILLCSAANALNQADRNVMPIAVIPMAEELDYSLMQRGMVLSSFAYGYICVQVPTQRLESMTSHCDL